MRAAGVVLAGVVLALGACGGEDGAAAPEGAASAQGAEAPAGGGGSGGPEVRTVAAANAMVPNKKVGEWRMTSAANGQEGRIHRVRHAGEQVWDANQSGGTCANFRARRRGDAPTGDMTMETRLTGDFQSRYVVETTVRNPSNRALPEARITTTGTYVGPTCS